MSRPPETLLETTTSAVFFDRFVDDARSRLLAPTICFPLRDSPREQKQGKQPVNFNFFIQSSAFHFIVQKSHMEEAPPHT